jgi:hypothetical protein
MPIQPEDVTDNHIKQVKDYLESQIGWPLMPDNSQLSTLANALIEAGIVSPPVWAVRNTKTGKLASHPMTRLKDLVPDKREPLVDGWEYELWKGQTE